MVDRISPQHRSWNMSRIRSKHTRPEKIVRSVLRRMHHRFKLHQRGLAGSPDIVLHEHRAVIFVHGCFWHRHANCRFAYKPKSRQEFWENKFAQNKRRDSKDQRTLVKQKWKVLTVWECQTGDPVKLQRQLERLFVPLLPVG